MSRRWLRALKANVLAAVVLSGGGGLPLLDVVLYHGLAPARFSEPHFEPTGAHCHGDLCRLDSRFPHSPQAESLDLRIRLVSTSFQGLVLAAVAPRAADPELLPLPRAPPGLPA